PLATSRVSPRCPSAGTSVIRITFIAGLSYGAPPASASSGRGGGRLTNLAEVDPEIGQADARHRHQQERLHREQAEAHDLEEAREPDPLEEVAEHRQSLDHVERHQHEEQVEPGGFEALLARGEKHS